MESTMSENGPDWSRAELENVREIMRQGEAYLGAQLTVAIAADQRAIRLAGALATIGSALIAAAFAMVTAHEPRWALGAGGGAAGVTMLMGMWFAWRAMRPCDFHYVGNHPRQWWNDADMTGKLALALGQQTEHCQDAIEKNAAVLDRNAEEIHRALRLTIAAPIVGGLTALGVLPFTS